MPWGHPSWSVWGQTFYVQDPQLITTVMHFKYFWSCLTLETCHLYIYLFLQLFFFCYCIILDEACWFGLWVIKALNYSLPFKIFTSLPVYHYSDLCPALHSLFSKKILYHIRSCTKRCPIYSYGWALFQPSNLPISIVGPRCSFRKYFCVFL